MNFQNSLREIWHILKILPWNHAFFRWIRLVPNDKQYVYAYLQLFSH